MNSRVGKSILPCPDSENAAQFAGVANQAPGHMALSDILHSPSHADTVHNGEIKPTKDLHVVFPGMRLLSKHMSPRRF